jgi:hypothetical protein
MNSLAQNSNLLGALSGAGAATPVLPIRHRVARRYSAATEEPANTPGAMRLGVMTTDAMGNARVEWTTMPSEPGREPQTATTGPHDPILPPGIALVANLTQIAFLAVPSNGDGLRVARDDMSTSELIQEFHASPGDLQTIAAEITFLVLGVPRHPTFQSAGPGPPVNHDQGAKDRRTTPRNRRYIGPLGEPNAPEQDVTALRPSLHRRCGSIPRSRRGLVCEVSAPGEIRTPDLRFRRPTLYPAELLAQGP